MEKLARPVLGHRAQRAGWSWALDLAAAQPNEPTFLRIARAISADIRRGRLGPETRLPGSRVLARTLEVHRNTVLAAYRELFAEGWIEARQGQGTFVSRDLRDLDRQPVRAKIAAAVRGRTGHVQPGFAFEAADTEPLPYRAHPNGTLRLWGGLPDLRLFPNEAFARAQRRVLRLSPNVLAYGDAYGHPRLRAALSTMLRTARGLVVEPDDILITRGSQMALALAAQAIVRPGDVVAVEAFGYRPVWRALTLAGARIVPVPVDQHGLRVSLLAELCERESVRAVYVTPHHQYPTTVPLAPARRIELLALAARARFAVLEDDYDHEFHYQGRPLLPLASADPAAVVIYAGTLSKVFAPGLRIGYVTAPRAVLADMARRRFYLDRQGDQLTECTLAELIEDGELQRHTRRMRRIYQLRRDACVRVFQQQLGEALSFRVPNGGMAMWARAAKGIDVERWAQSAEAAGVSIQCGRQFRSDNKPCPFVRLGYALLDEEEMVEAVRRLRKALPG
jgi:GntR family transcriptional regulator/MocR family aminotransferase